MTDLQRLLETLLSRELGVRPTDRPVEVHDAAVLWSYSFPDGRLAAVGALDLPGALSLGAALGLLPRSSAAVDPQSGRIPDALMDNVREVLNVLAGLYHALSDLPLRLSAVWTPAADRDDEARVLAYKTGRLDATITIPGYPPGRISAAYALITT